MYKKFAGIFVALSILVMPAIASAHVVVTPKQANIAQHVVFSVSVPNEEQVEVTTVKVNIPMGVKEVTPTAKPGWTITTTDNGSVKDPAITSISWSAGSIPVGQRDDFTFEAQTPSKAAPIIWKAIQTYADGTVVHWDQKPTTSDDSTGNVGPYSVTSVIDDLKTSPKPADDSNDDGNLPLIFSVVALAISVVGFVSARKKN